MSDLQPRGVPVTIAGEERKLLLSLSAIDHIQELYPGKSVYSVLLEMIENHKKQAPGYQNMICNLLSILWNDAVMRDHLLNPEQPIGERYEPEQIAYFVNIYNVVDVENAIIEACRISTPNDEDEDDDPNMTGEADK